MAHRSIASRTAALSLILLGVALSSGFAQRPITISPGSLDSLVEAYLLRNHIPSIGLFIGTTNGRSVFARSYGTARRSPASVATPQTEYLLASVSKPYAAVAAHRLAELHRLDLGAPISRYLGTLPRWGDSISVRQLLSHSSGILDFTDVVGWNDTSMADTFIEKALASPLRFPPGSRTEYSNTNYALVQRIIEGVSGRRYAAVAAELVLAPLGLAETHFDCASGKYDLAQGYRLGSDDELVPVAAPLQGHYPDATAGLCASPRDVARFFSSILSGRLLGQTSIEDLHTAQGVTPGEDGFGAGLSVAHETTGEVWEHSGAVAGGSTDVVLWPTDSLMIVVLANVGGAEVGTLTRQIARLALGIEQPPVVDLPLKAEMVGRYAGRYDVDNGRILVGERGGHVYALGQRCYYQGGDVFICDPEKSRTIRFIGDSSGVREAWLIVEGVRRLRGVRARP